MWSVEPSAVRFELYNGASDSDRVAWMYASIRIRYGMHDITNFKYSGRKEFNRVRPSFRSCENKMNEEIWETDVKEGAHLLFSADIAAFSLIYLPPWLPFRPALSLASKCGAPMVIFFTSYYSFSIFKAINLILKIPSTHTIVTS